jgi:hypothetical protein
MLSSFWLHRLLLQMIFINFYSKIIWNIQIGVDMNFFCGKFSPFCNKYYIYIYFPTNSWIFLKNREKITKNSKNATKITTIACNLKICLNFFFPYFEFCQTCLNTIMGYNHLSIITKLKKKTVVAIPHFLQYYNYLSKMCQLLMACIVCKS